MIHPPSLSLLPFQKTGVELMLKHLKNNQGVYCGDDCGLGKTIQTIVTLNTLNNGIPIGDIYIICPAVMRLVWRDELIKWLWPQYLEDEIKIYKSKIDYKDIGKFRVNIISYQLATRELFLNALKKLDVKILFLILDEAHRVKTSKAKRTKAIFKHIWPRAFYKIALSGTPFTKSVEDGYTLFHRFNPDYFPDWYTYCNTYMNRKHNGFGVQYEGLKNAEKLKKGLKTFFFRRTKEKVLPELPAVTYKKISLDSSYAVKLSAEQKTEMDAYYKELREMLGKDAVFKVKPPPVPVMTIRREQGRKKTDAIIEYVELLLEQNVPVVLFGIFRDELTKIELAFKKYKPAVINGDISGDQRQEHIRRFQSGGTLLFIGQMASASEGITLTASSNVVLSETPYSPAEIKQAIDRCNRMGQKNTVTVHYFVVDKSVDEKIIDSVMKKAEIFGRVLG